jgi:ketosteroid isomerase-like protein
MNDAAALAVMQRFGKAYFSKDPAQLAQAITPDAEWHFAFGPDAPDGRVRKGVAGFMQGIAENDALFEKLRFNDVVIRALDDRQLVMTYLLDGRYRGGEAFALRGIELVTVRDGKVDRKDVFWKQYRPG